MEPKLIEHLVAIRRQIHSNPELGYQEFETADLICKELYALNIPFRRNIAKTGVIAELKKGEGPCIVLRADMDALPMKEKNRLSFASNKVMKVKDKKAIPLMHACGHDIHTTILLGAVHLLKESDFKGLIKFIFQPSEEGTYNDEKNQSGGQRIAESGELDDVTAAVGLHVYPKFPVGKVIFVLGQALANVNFFTIEITGKAVHAGMEPEKGKDAIMIAVQLIQEAQLIVSRLTSPTEPVVVSFTQIEGGTNQNILASKVTLKGTIRTLDLKTYQIVIEKLQRIIRGLKYIYSVKIAMKIDLYYPSLLNDKSVHNKISGTLNEIFGIGNVVEAKPLLGGEDFAFYSRKVPSMFYFLGAQDTAEKVFSIHEPEVVFNEDCIPFGVELLTKSALKLFE